MRTHGSRRPRREGRSDRGRPDGSGRTLLVPRTLKAALAQHSLPESLRRAAALPAGASVADLRAEELGRIAEARRERIRRDFCQLAVAAWPEVRDVRILDRPWPARLDPRSVDWPVRVRRSLLRAGLLDDRRWLSEVTYARVLALTAVGIRSVFDFALTAEAAVDPLYDGVEVPAGLVELARRIVESRWASRVSGADPRFRDLLGTDERVLAERVRVALESWSTHSDDWLGLARTLPPLVERVSRIDMLPLDVALHEYVEALHGLDGPSCAAVLARLGLDGRRPRTLVEATQDVGFSAERLRQIVVRLRARVPSHPVHMPALDRAIELLAAAAPCRADDGALLLHGSGVATAPFHPSSVLSAAELCGRQAPFEVEETPKGMYVVTDRAASSRADLVRLAHAQVSRFGAASLSELTGALAAGSIDVAGNRGRDVVHDGPRRSFLTTLGSGPPR